MNLFKRYKKSFEPDNRVRGYLDNRPLDDFCGQCGKHKVLSIGATVSRKMIYECPVRAKLDGGWINHYFDITNIDNPPSPFDPKTGEPNV